MLNDKNKHAFCPAHWDDIHYAPSQGYLYGCCKATPIPIEDVNELDQRKQNALDGVRNPSCNYCWKTEDAGNESLRHNKLREWDGTSNCRKLTLVLGNLCNLQCTYCNEKYSSKWQTDKKRFGEIKMQYDTDIYYAGKTCVNKESQVYIDFYNKTKPKSLTVSGGEPLIGNVFKDILTECDLSQLQDISVSTNLNYTKRDTIDKLLEFKDSHNITLNASLDTVDSNVQEYLRFGFNMDRFKSNLYDLLDNTPVRINFITLVTAQSVKGIYNLCKFVYHLKTVYPNRVNWYASTCVTPATHTFDILTETERAQALDEARKVQQEIQDQLELININKVIATLENAKYNEELRNDQSNFFKQFNERQDIQTPQELGFLIDANR